MYKTKTKTKKNHSVTVKNLSSGERIEEYLKKKTHEGPFSKDWKKRGGKKIKEKKKEKGNDSKCGNGI